MLGDAGRSPTECMAALNATQIERIEYLATDAWVVDSGSPDDDTVSNANFTRVLNAMSSIELHHFACNFNWDCGTDELAAVVDHPDCDAGTALMIFWLGQPAHYFRAHKRNKLTESETPVFAWLDSIARRLVSGDFSCCNIACDPFDIMGQPFATGSDRERELIDARLYDKLQGESIVPHLC